MCEEMYLKLVSGRFQGVALSRKKKNEHELIAPRCVSLLWPSDACAQVVNMVACVSRSGSWCVCQIAAMKQRIVIDVDEQRLFAMSVQGFGSRSGGAIFSWSACNAFCQQSRWQ